MLNWNTLNFICYNLSRNSYQRASVQSKMILALSAPTTLKKKTNQIERNVANYIRSFGLNVLDEKLCGTVGQQLTCSVHQNWEHWDTSLPSIILGIRSRVTTSTSHSPFSYLYGVEPNLPQPWFFNSNKSELNLGWKFSNSWNWYLMNRRERWIDSSNSRVGKQLH